MATYELIEHIEVGSGGAASIEFTSIPADYDDLLLVASLRFARAVISTPVKLLLNGTDFTARNLYGDSNTTGSQTVTADYIGWSPAANSTSNTFGNLQIYIPNYTASGAKCFSADVVDENNGNAFQAIDAGLTTTTTAIVTLELSDQAAASNAVQYSSATLYGIRKYDTAGSPKATGGIISFDSANNKWVHTFTASGTFTPTEDITCDYLVIAGGGGGGYGAGSGGGAGGFRADTGLLFELATDYTVTIGAGSPGATTVTSASNGANSVFSTITSAGGGGGVHGKTAVVGQSGGSGSGGGGQFATGSSIAGGAGNTPSTSPAQGFSGGTGTGISGDRATSGGGGGAGANGSNATTAASGAGGSGESNSITGTSVIRAGGGGGGGGSGGGGATAAGSGGSGGGGAGGTQYSSGSAGTVNTGGGGGGGGDADQSGGNGGSGIVIVRYNA